LAVLEPRLDERIVDINQHLQLLNVGLQAAYFSLPERLAATIYAHIVRFDGLELFQLPVELSKLLRLVL
jgi:hypothetical protein